jgi:hypothetical protein
MTIKLLLTALLSSLAAAIVFYAMVPAGAAEATQVHAPPTERYSVPPAVAWPAPQEPFDTTPITGVETVGAAAFEPF